MNFLGRIPFWAWYLFSLAFCYAIWNPWFSLWQVVEGPYEPSVKAVCIIAAIAVFSLYVVEGHRTLNVFGIVLFVALTASIFWFAFDRGFRGFTSIHLWGQIIVALFLTIAVQGGRVYRSLTGRVPVGGDGADHHGAHHS